VNAHGALHVAMVFVITSVACAQVAWFREAENFDQWDEGGIFAPHIGYRNAASGGKFVVVRSHATGRPTWVEYDVEVNGGVYELWLRCGGNDTRQAAKVSIDGGEPITVVDQPMLPPHTKPPKDARERSRMLENTFREVRVGFVKLSRGRHRIRLAHAELEGTSNSFGVDWLKLIVARKLGEPIIRVGDKPQPEGRIKARLGERTLDLLVETPQRYYGRDECAFAAVMIRNNASQPLNGLSLDVRILRDGRMVERSHSERLPTLKPRLWLMRCIRLKMHELEPDVYELHATVSGAPLNEPVIATRKLICSKLSVPAWAKRACITWHRYHIGDALDAHLKGIDRKVESGATVIVNANVALFMAEEGWSYPFRGDRDNLVALARRCHERDANLLMYHSAITVSEHFYYYHKRYWNGRPPFYHCAWLSIYPDSPQWQAHQARDFKDLLSRYPLDGIFLDNACASGCPNIRTEKGERGLLKHFCGLRAAIKSANPIGVLYPNYNALTMLGLRICSAGWDAHMLEGPYAASSGERSGRAFPVAEFCRAWARVRRISGKPFWSLMYAPTRYRQLSIAACVAARCNPAVSLDAQYCNFMRRIREYVYAENVFDAPADVVTYHPDDADIVVMPYVRVYEGGVCDWIFHIVNGLQENGKPKPRTVHLRFNVPLENLRGSIFILRPEGELEWRKVASELDVTVQQWCVLIITEALEPQVKFEPMALMPTIGELYTFTVALTNPNAMPLEGTIETDAPDGWHIAPVRFRIAGGAMERVKLTLTSDWDAVERAVSPMHESVQVHNFELRLRIRYSERFVEIPKVVRPCHPIEVDVYPDHFGIPFAKPQTELRLTNHTNREIACTVEIAPPDGWDVRPKKAHVRIAPNERRIVKLMLSFPNVKLRNLYDMRDYPMTVTVRFDGKVLRRVVKMRLHVPHVWTVYCTLGAHPKDIVRTGATPQGGFLSQIVMTVRGRKANYDSAREALMAAIERQRIGEQRVVVWFRTGEGKCDQLADAEVQRLMREFISIGGAILFQENVFRSSEANRALLRTDLCPIGQPYEPLDDSGGDWRVAMPKHPAVEGFARLVCADGRAFAIPKYAQPKRVRFRTKSWAQVIAVNERGEPAVIVSADPKRPVAYIAGSLEGEYINRRHGVHEYPNQMAHLLVFYADLIRWLATFGEAHP